MPNTSTQQGKLSGTLCQDYLPTPVSTSALPSTMGRKWGAQYQKRTGAKGWPLWDHSPPEDQQPPSTCSLSSSQNDKTCRSFILQPQRDWHTAQAYISVQYASPTPGSVVENGSDTVSQSPRATVPTFLQPQNPHMRHSFPALQGLPWLLFNLPILVPT